MLKVDTADTEFQTYFWLFVRHSYIPIFFFDWGFQEIWGWFLGDLNHWVFQATWLAGFFEQSDWLSFEAIWLSLDFKQPDWTGFSGDLIGFSGNFAGIFRWL